MSCDRDDTVAPAMARTWRGPMPCRPPPCRQGRSLPAPSRIWRASDCPPFWCMPTAARPPTYHLCHRCQRQLVLGLRLGQLVAQQQQLPAHAARARDAPRRPHSPAPAQSWSRGWKRGEVKGFRVQGLRCRVEGLLLPCGSAPARCGRLGDRRAGCRTAGREGGDRQGGRGRQGEQGTARRADGWQGGRAPGTAGRGETGRLENRHWRHDGTRRGAAAAPCLLPCLLPPPRAAFPPPAAVPPCPPRLKPPPSHPGPHRTPTLMEGEAGVRP